MTWKILQRTYRLSRGLKIFNVSGKIYRYDLDKLTIYKLFIDLDKFILKSLWSSS